MIKNELTEGYQIMSLEQTATFLAVSRTTIYRWTEAGILTSYKLGGKIFYKKDEVIKALNDRKQV